MEIQYLKSLQQKRISCFTFPVVLMVIFILFAISTEYFLLQSRLAVVNKNKIEKEILNDLLNIGNQILRNSLLQTDPITLKQNITLNPKVYLDTNGDNTKDSLLLFSCTNLTESVIDFVIIGYRLKRSEIGKITHPLKTLSVDINGNKTINILSANYFTETLINEYISFSLPDKKVSMLKRLSIVYTK